MELFYSIRELARMLKKSVYDISSILGGANIPMTHNGQPADLSGWTGGISSRGNNVYVMDGYYDDPDPSEVLVLTDLLPASWVKKLQQHEVETDEIAVDAELITDGTIHREAAKPIARQRFQEEEILRVIGELGHDPKRLPKDIYGKPGVKADVRAKLAFTPTVFDKAWERLSKSNDIVKLK